MLCSLSTCSQAKLNNLWIKRRQGYKVGAQAFFRHLKCLNITFKFVTVKNKKKEKCNFKWFNFRFYLTHPPELVSELSNLWNFFRNVHDLATNDEQESCALYISLGKPNIFGFPVPLTTGTDEKKSMDQGKYSTLDLWIHSKSISGYGFQHSIAVALALVVLAAYHGCQPSFCSQLSPSVMSTASPDCHWHPGRLNPCHTWSNIHHPVWWQIGARPSVPDTGVQWSCTILLGWLKVKHIRYFSTTAWGKQTNWHKIQPLSAQEVSPVAGAQSQLLATLESWCDVAVKSIKLLLGCDCCCYLRAKKKKKRFE